MPDTPLVHFSPSWVRGNMRSDQWREYHQQDAHEFLVALLDEMQNEVLHQQDKVRCWGVYVGCGREGRREGLVR